MYYTGKVHIIHKYTYVVQLLHSRGCSANPCQYLNLKNAKVKEYYFNSALAPPQPLNLLKGKGVGTIYPSIANKILYYKYYITRSFGTIQAPASIKDNREKLSESTIVWKLEQGTNILHTDKS